MFTGIILETSAVKQGKYESQNMGYNMYLRDLDKKRIIVKKIGNEEMTEEEVAAIESAIQEQIAAEAKRPLTMEEVIKLTIAKTINSIAIEDETALRMVEYYPAPDAASYAAGDRIQYNGKLYKCLQAHTA